jgi:transcriptional regulator with XRE-family HTH domain
MVNMDYSTTINTSCLITLGRLITSCKRNAGLSQKELAQKLSCHYSIHLTELLRIECDRLPVYDSKFAWLSSAIALEFDLDAEWVETIRSQTKIREGFMLVSAANFPQSKTVINIKP